MISYRNNISLRRKFTRVLTDNFCTATIQYNDYDRNYSAVHLGQRKLMFSEIEFFNIVTSEIGNDLSNYLVVYIGSAPGSHFNIILELFPTISCILYDPRPFDIPESNRVIIKTGTSGFFTHDKVPDVLKIAKNREIIYICDMRGDVNEIDVWNNMWFQQEWGVMINAKYMLLKMRPPYDDVENDKYIFSGPINTVAQIKIPQFIMIPKGFIYLEGDIYFQIYPPKKSSETRLLVRRNEGYKYKLYDYSKYDISLAYFNQVYRKLTFRFRDSNDTKNHLLGYDDSYESVSEYKIIYDYICKTDTRCKHSNIIKFMHDINMKLLKYTQQNLITSILLTPISPYLKNFEIPNNADTLYKHIKTIMKYFDMVDTIKISYSNQVRSIKNSNILSTVDINNQFKSFEKIISHVPFYIKNNNILSNPPILYKIKQMYILLLDEYYKKLSINDYY